VRAAPPLRDATIDAEDVVRQAPTGSVIGWLPPLIGREAELAQAARLLERARLLTLTGAGGVGKTRLALALTERLPAGLFDVRVFVELATLEPSDGEPTDMEPVVSAIWRAVAAASSGGVQSIGAPLDRIARRLADRRALLVLDNCEHLPVLSELTGLLLRRCPELRVLATSRRALELPAETVWQVPPLSLPVDNNDTEVLAAVLESEAGRLFVQRAQRSLPSFSLTAQTAPSVAEICRRLDGLALAIELAATRVRILSPHQIRDGLADRFQLLTAGPASALGRHQTLRGSLDWSYALIDDEARALLRCLSVVYEWSLQAIETVAGPRSSVLDPLTSLVDAGLAGTVPDGDVLRYRLPESVRSYALELLAEAGEELDVRRAHLTHFRALASDAGRLLDDDAGRRRLELESRNLQAALDFAVGDDPDAALEMTADLRHWLLLAGGNDETRELCARVLAAASDSDPVARAHVLFTAALLAVFAEDYAHARAYAEEALPLAQGSGDGGAIGVGLMLASVGRRSFDPSESARLGRQAVQLLRSAGARHDLALAAAQLAMTEALRDRFDAVRGACEEFDELTHGQPPSWLAVWLQTALAWADIAQGYPREALAHCERGLELEGERSSLGYYITLAHKLHALTMIGEARHALELGTSAGERAQEDGLAVAVIALQGAVGLAEVALGELRPARERAEQRFSDAHISGAADSHELLARIDLAQRRPGPLGRHAAALRTIGQHAGNPRVTAIASWADGAAALLADELEQAGTHLHEALALQIEHSLRPDAIDTVEALAELQIVGGHAEAGARLLGAMRRSRAELELCRLPERASHFGQLAERAEQELGSDRWAAAVAEGQGLKLEDAFDYARRGRGQRVVSRSGLGSLTPTERSVVEAAAEGLTNAAIAKRLFMSHGTVKAHLAHAYKKLDVGNRVQLSAFVRDHAVADEASDGIWTGVRAP
jgi:predicted ATPase/DNA-binding CsgD family transcriptional regulator